jgi:hypothetical protein
MSLFSMLNEIGDSNFIISYNNSKLSNIVFYSAYILFLGLFLDLLLLFVFMRLFRDKLLVVHLSSND